MKNVIYLDADTASDDDLLWLTTVASLDDWDYAFVIPWEMTEPSVALDGGPDRCPKGYHLERLVEWVSASGGYWYEGVWQDQQTQHRVLVGVAHHA